VLSQSQEIVASHVESEPLAYRAVRGGLWVAVSSYFNVGFGFLANLALTRILAPEDFGIFALAGFTAVAFFAIIMLVSTQIEEINLCNLWFQEENLCNL
jgi:hypothetical protein